MEISESPFELSNFVSVMPITVGFDIFTISLSLSNFGSKLFIFKCIKCRPLFLNISQFSFRWLFWINPRLKLISPESGSISFRKRKWFLWHFIWLRQFSCKHSYWFSLFKSSQILIDSIKKNSLVVHKVILLWWLNLMSDQYSVRSDKKSCIKNMWIKTICFKKTFTISKPIATRFIQKVSVSEGLQPQKSFSQDVDLVVKVLPKCDEIAKMTCIKCNNVRTTINPNDWIVFVEM